MKKDKPVLIIIIILLIIFVPLSTYGIYLKVTVPEEVKKTNDLTFYDGDTAIGGYECIISGCNYAKSIGEEETLNSYKGEEEYVMKVINSSYAFISDNNKIILYDILIDTKVTEFNNIKYYDKNNTSNLLFLQNNEGLWGAISLKNFKVVIPYEYDYLALANNMQNNLIDASTIIAKKNNAYFLINDDNEVLSSSYINLITDYNDNILISNNKVYDYDNNDLLSNIIIKEIIYLENYYVIIDTESNLYVYSKDFTNLITSIIVPSYTSIEVKDNFNLEVYLDNELYQSLTVK